MCVVCVSCVCGVRVWCACVVCVSWVCGVRVVSVGVSACRVRVMCVRACAHVVGVGACVCSRVCVCVSCAWVWARVCVRVDTE